MIRVLNQHSESGILLAPNEGYTKADGSSAIAADNCLAIPYCVLTLDLSSMGDDLTRFVNNLLSKTLESGIVLFRSAVYNSSAISFGEKMTRMISIGHLSKNCTYELNLGTVGNH
ncbi:hypothetical protein AB835_12800 [Candidatus Endobugula sertula]|uniref:Uncharacterized protein n=1 Tax=Candidatus Endobugula sertula TaxID=62101 RepID=A0A1D2QM97_9GAMM|nr:hypothetical protein AB835_12800 [Candidatus Endobugula sertula]